MDIHNELYSEYTNKRIGKKELMVALDKGFINAESFVVISENTPNYTLDEAKTVKKEECSYICEKRILEGIDVELSDGSEKHFSLKEKDQLNLTLKSIDVATGVQRLEYHSDGDPCRYYSSEDMSRICVMAKTKVTTETTYYNCLSQWIEGCETVEEVLSIEYGQEVPDKYWSEPWKDIAQAVAAYNETGELPIGDFGSGETGEKTDSISSKIKKVFSKKKA